MAQYYEVVSDGTVDQTHQFFNGNQDNEGNERPQVEYIQIAAENSPQFQTQQVLLSGDQVMVLDGTQQQIQRVVIDQGHTFATSSQQFSTIVQSSSMNSHQRSQIYYVEASSSDNVQSVQTSQAQVQPQPIVLNHQMSATNTNPRQGAPVQRLQLRAPVRQTLVQQTRPLSLTTRQAVPQLVRTQQQPAPARNMSPQIQMRVRTASPQAKLQQIPQQLQQHVRQTQAQLNQQAKAQFTHQKPQTSTQDNQQAQAQLLGMNRTNNLQKLQHQQAQQQRPQMAPQPQQVAQHPQQSVQQPQQVVQQPKQMVRQQQVVEQQSQSQSQFQKILSEYQQSRQQQKAKAQEAELDDHDPSMNNTPSGQIATYKKLLEQRPLAKNTILSRLPSNIKVTQTSQHQSQTIDEVVNQFNQSTSQQQPIRQPQQQLQPVQLLQQQQQQQQHQIVQPSVEPANPILPNIITKRARAAPRPRNPTAVARGPPGSTPNAIRVPRPPMVHRQFNNENNGRMVVPPQPPAGPRFVLNQQQHQLLQRFENQQRSQYNQQAAQQSASYQDQNLPIQQNGVSSTVNLTPPRNTMIQPRNVQTQHRNNQSQMNYLITHSNTGRHPQGNTPYNLSQTQLQQIISMFKDNAENRMAVIPDENDDSIKMLVLLENGEQRLITFTLPKEACTIQEILEEVNVPFTSDTDIQVSEVDVESLNYVVTVGNIAEITYGIINNEEPLPEPGLVENLQQNSRAHYHQQPKLPLLASGPVLPQPEPPKPPSPEPPKLIPGKLAVCFICGYTGEDFNKCTRCSRKLPDNVRSVDANVDFIQKDILKPQIKINLSPQSSCSPKQDNPAKAPLPAKKKITKPKAVENESVVISSDEEEDYKRPARLVSEQLLNKLGSSISISPITKEPSLSEIKKHVRKFCIEDLKPCRIGIKCRTIRIGSYRFEVKDDIILDSKCIVIKAPVRDSNEIKTIRIDRGDIIKVLVCYHKSLPLMFFYLNSDAAPVIRDMLNLTKDSGCFFDPLEDKEVSYRNITVLSDNIDEDLKPTLQLLYGGAPASIIDELSLKEANDILMKSCPRDAVVKLESQAEMKHLLIYPKEGPNRLSINTEDYVCLAADQFLNDKIIDFYLTYLWEHLPQEQQRKVHVFSTFFYKRLTSKAMKVAKKSNPNETETLTAAEKRHARVKNWTKKINIFEKDFIILPINESAHWFLAIICFPGLKGPETFEGVPYVAPLRKAKVTKKKKVCNKSQKNVEEVKKEIPIICDEPLSDKDEAESEDSELVESDDSEESIAAIAIAAAAAAPAAPLPLPGKSKAQPKVPIKQPCILIFDSLAGPSRNRVIATLRDYLTCEYKTKMETERVYNKDVIKGSCCKVPQQTNFTDCGLYVLQYVEQFFKDPITDYNTPIKGIKDWFEEIVVTKKREDICNLIKDLMVENGTDTKILPEIALPTLNGKVIERPESEHEHNHENPEDQEDMFTDIEDSELMAEANASTVDQNQSTMEEMEPEEECQEEASSNEDQSSYENSWPSPIKPSECSLEEKSDIVATSGSLRPTLSEFSKQTSSKATLNYLKSIRIDRHKVPNDEPDFKKTKLV
ncbi:unnamed protein product [Ceutorhynchus assimilis]|uniref:Ubiquitin-like protease family profile domain-containing protein n=1 Tax=Ceutorhynchus assimilis TaxID=467358 RepID=A0A9N9MPV1_9CUCU|nr:unnamed protein product [Ceutorhynchus assimilis]